MDCLRRKHSQSGPDRHVDRRDVVSGDEQAYDEIAKSVPIGRARRPEEIASVVLWLWSAGANYVLRGCRD